MKKFVFLFACLALAFSCDDNDDPGYAEYLVARPLTMDLTEFRNSVSVMPPEPIQHSGKIYVYGNYVFVNDTYKGVHVIDNTNPKAPKKIAFIQILGNVDISVKDHYLYADSLSDLVVLDIADLNNIEEVDRLENVLNDYTPWPFEADIIEYTGGATNEVIIGWETTMERRPVQKSTGDPVFFDGAPLASENASGGNVGQGGSLARFTIVDQYLYAVDHHNINVFDISNLEAPQDLPDVAAGFDIETIFYNGSHLFLGSMRGMYIYDIADPAAPSPISEFEHGTACDPVVVDGDYAYVTLRGGNACGATESGLFVIDISNISNPVLEAQYPLDGPYGLGVKDDRLFVCDGESGLKVYDKTDVDDLKEVGHFKDVVAYDVIPLQNVLLMIGEGTLYEYHYADGDLELLSTLSLK